MTTVDVEQSIKESKRMNKRERLEALRDLAEEIANSFQENMSILECEIDNALDNTGERIKNELGYNSVADVTQDISIISTWDF